MATDDWWLWPSKPASSQVYRATDIETGEIVALKEIRRKKERIPQIIKREVNTLKMLHHENIVQLKEIVFSRDGSQSKGSMYMVFEYMDHDLWGLMHNDEVQITVPQIKCYMKQLLAGLQYCHDNGVLHRDIKGENLLLDNEGNLKIADFGLARTFPNDPNEALTNRVVTLWYRPPELLLGSCNYGPAVDMWSVGCVFAELLWRRPFLGGKDVTDQLNKIYEMFGGANDCNWPGVSKLPLYNTLKPTTEMKGLFKETFPNHDRHAVMLLERMLALDPSQRISVKDALEDDYFCINPLPCDPKSLPKFESSLNFLVDKRKEEKLQPEKSSTHQSTPIPSLKQ